MGRALKNLDRLLQMPTGSGEQNMIILAPNIYILLYLEVTGQLTAAIRETATGYLQSGMDLFHFTFGVIGLNICQIHLEK